VVDTLRCFVGLRLGPVAQGALVRGLERLGRRESGVRWVRPDQLHVTLSFLGQVDAASVAEIAAALAHAGAGAPLRLGLDGVGHFPPRGAPRVLWAGLGGNLDALSALQARVEEALLGAGVETDGKPFHAHVTLGRVKRPSGVREVLTALDELGLHTDPEAVVELVLFESRLSPAGAEYRELGRFPT